MPQDGSENVIENASRGMEPTHEPDFIYVIEGGDWNMCYQGNRGP
jgi:hypothetical protein